MRIPDLFLSRMQMVIPKLYWNDFLKSLTQVRKTTFRINRLIDSDQTVISELQDLGFGVQSVPWYSDAYVLKKLKQRDLEKTNIYLDGRIYLQNLSSMIPPLVLNPQPGETILELAAAPGGKVTQLASLARNQARIFANEKDKIRWQKLRFNIIRQNATSILLLEPSDGRRLGQHYFEQFDKVLLDAPCSSEGKFLASHNSTYQHWNIQVIQQMAKLQRQLLNSAVLALKPGGILVYSTCTFAPEENEGILNDILAMWDGKICLEPINTFFPRAQYGLTRFQGQQFDASLSLSRRILPNDQWEGFFVARLKKTKAVDNVKLFLEKN
jgi:16S rRNA (cytosine1407-C5)-methyltransferase